MSNATTHGHDGPYGTSLLPRDQSEHQLAAAPVLESLDDIEVDDLTDDEYQKFIAALS